MYFIWVHGGNVSQFYFKDKESEKCLIIIGIMVPFTKKEIDESTPSINSYPWTSEGYGRIFNFYTLKG